MVSDETNSATFEERIKSLKDQLRHCNDRRSEALRELNERGKLEMAEWKKGELKRLANEKMELISKVIDLKRREERYVKVLVLSLALNIISFYFIVLFH